MSTVQSVLHGLVLLAVLLLWGAAGPGAVATGADMGNGEAVAGELHPVLVHSHLFRSLEVINRPGVAGAVL